MKKTALALGVLALTGACMMPPEDVTEADLAAWDAAVASIGCDLVGESDYLPVELQTGLPRQKVIEIAQYRLGLDQAVPLDNGGVRLITGICAPQTVPAAPATGATT
jgi:hypothetical protein